MTITVIKNQDSERTSIKFIISVASSSILPFLYGIGLVIGRSINPSLKNNLYNNYETTILFSGGLISSVIIYNLKSEKTNIFKFIALTQFLSYFLILFKNQGLIVFCRFLTGLAGGAIGSTVPCYLSLISPLNLRGLISTLYVVAVVGGLIFYNSLRFIITPNFEIFIVLILMLSFLSFSLSFFSIKMEKGGSDGYSGKIIDLLKNSSSYKSIMLIALFNLANNLSGINTITFNPKQIFGEQDMDQHLVYSFILSLIIALSSGALLERVGRKVLVLASTLVCGICCLAFYYSFNNIIFGYVLSIGFNLGLSNIPFILMAEIFPKEFISPGTLFGTIFNYLGAMISCWMESLDASIKYNSIFKLYIGYLTVFSVVVLACYKETMGVKPRFQ